MLRDGLHIPYLAEEKMLSGAEALHGAEGVVAPTKGGVTRVVDGQGALIVVAVVVTGKCMR